MFKIKVKPLTVNQCYRAVKGRSIKSKKYREFEKEINSQLPNHLLQRLAQQFNVDKHYFIVEFYFSLSKMFTKKDAISLTAGDYDNFIKPIQDLIFKRLETFNPKINDAQILKGIQYKLPSTDDSICALITLGDLEEYRHKIHTAELM